MFDGDAYFASFAYLLSGGDSSSGQYQPYIRFTENSPTVGEDSDLGELGINYVISAHNLRLNLNYTSGDANASGAKGADIDAITFGMQIQI